MQNGSLLKDNSGPFCSDIPMQRWLWILSCLVLLGWWFSPPIHTAHASAPGELAPDMPVQDDIDHGTPFPDGDFTITPLADFRMTARVLSRADYRFDHGAALSPTDLAFGWGRMSDSSVLAKLDIWQSGRWYYYHWNAAAPPIPRDEIVRSSANMHMIPADDSVRRALRRIREGDVVHLEGQLIEAHGKDGSIWRSSMTNDATGDGACKVVFVRKLVVM